LPTSGKVDFDLWILIGSILTSGSEFACLLDIFIGN